MKILFIIIGILLTLAAAFFAVGLFFPSVAYQTTVEIDRPLDVSWNYFTDEKNMPDWLPGFESIETLSGKPNEVGSKFLLRINENGSKMEFTETVTEFKPRELFAFTLEHSMMTNNVRVKFTEKDGKTIVTQEEKLVGANIFWRSFFVFAITVSKSNARQVLEKLKANIENLPQG